MSAKFDSAARYYANGRADAEALAVDLAQELANIRGLTFTPLTIARHHAAMSRVQMIARKIAECALDAQVECDIATAEEASA